MTRRAVISAVWAVVIVGVSASVCAKTVRSFDEKVYLEVSGRASAVWTITGVKDSTTEMLLPWNYRQDPASLTVSPAGRLAARIVVLEGASFLALRSAQSIEFDTVTLRFDVPDFFPFAAAKRLDFGNVTVRKKIVNTTLIQIDRLSAELFLPPGYDIAVVDETLPEQPSGESASPFVILRSGDRNGIGIAMDTARLGDALYVKMKVKSSSKSPVLFIVFVCIGIAYLVVFRDIITQPNGPSSSAASV